MNRNKSMKVNTPKCYSGFCFLIFGNMVIFKFLFYWNLQGHKIWLIIIFSSWHTLIISLLMAYYSVIWLITVSHVLSTYDPSTVNKIKAWTTPRSLLFRNSRRCNKHLLKGKQFSYRNIFAKIFYKMFSQHKSSASWSSWTRVWGMHFWLDIMAIFIA